MVDLHPDRGRAEDRVDREPARAQVAHGLDQRAQGRRDLEGLMAADQVRGLTVDDQAACLRECVPGEIQDGREFVEHRVDRRVRTDHRAAIVGHHQPAHRQAGDRIEVETDVQGVGVEARVLRCPPRSRGEGRARPSPAAKCSGRSSRVELENREAKSARLATPTPVVTAVDPFCLEPDLAGTYDGAIVVCLRGTNDLVAKSANVAAGGAGGMLVRNSVPGGTVPSSHFVPAVHLSVDDGILLQAFLSTHDGVTATFEPGRPVDATGDVMTSFSSRGGADQTLGVNKPDLVAPGLDVLAGHTPQPSTVVGGRPGELFQLLSGTSMSAPHAAGAAALMVASHPEWGPGDIKSALMMSAGPTVTAPDGSPATPFDRGSGRLQVDQALDAGFTISADASDFVARRDDLWNANYPSVYVPAMGGTVRVKRILEEAAGEDSTWSVSVDADAGLTIVPSVELVDLRAGGTTEIGFVIDARDVPLGEVRHGSVNFTDDTTGAVLRLPVTIVRGYAGLDVDHRCESPLLVRDAPTSCSITVTNNMAEAIDVELVNAAPTQVEIDASSVRGDGATIEGGVLRGTATLAAEVSTEVTVASDPGGSPAGYLSMGDFGAEPVTGFTDESIINFSVAQPFVYGEESYGRIGVGSNGYVVVGGGTAEDIEYINTDLPDPTRPDNLLAPFWTDLDPSAGGDVFVEVFSSADNDWLVVEWRDVPTVPNGLLNSFQIWIGMNGVEDITYTYGRVDTDADGPGSTGFLTVGAENADASSGQAVYFDGAGRAPAAGDELRVTSAAGSPGGSYEVTFDLVGRRWGPFRSSAIVSSPQISTDSINTLWGRVVVSETVTATLSDDTSVPEVISPGTGEAVLRLNRFQGVACLDLDAVDLAGEVTAGRIHEGPEGERGPVVIDFEVDAAVFDDCVSGVDPAVVGAVVDRPEDFYVSIGTTSAPDGEIRGQLRSGG